MKCKSTNIPPREEVDIAALKEKYRQERERRLRPDGQEQYAPSTDHFTHDTMALCVNLSLSQLILR